MKPKTPFATAAIYCALIIFSNAILGVPVFHYSTFHKNCARPDAVSPVQDGGTAAPAVAAQSGHPAFDGCFLCTHLAHFQLDHRSAGCAVSVKYRVEIETVRAETVLFHSAITDLFTPRGPPARSS